MNNTNLWAISIGTFIITLMLLFTLINEIRDDYNYYGKILIYPYHGILFIAAIITFYAYISSVTQLINIL